MADPRTKAILDSMSDEDVTRVLFNLVAQQKLKEYQPYPYQVEFHQAGAWYPERLLRAGNRVGKTFGACCEDVYHLTGGYPEWWEGKTFPKATRGWVVSITNETSRDILQRELLGEPIGTGLLPYDAIHDIEYRQCGISNVVDTIYVKHKDGNLSTATFKVYEQGWRKFSGAAIDFAHLDEEPDQLRVYTEIRTRIITRGGTMYSTLTPLLGDTELIRRFAEHKEGTFMITASMTECPLLQGKVEAIVADYPEHEKEARINGTPIIGEGRVFPYADNDVLTPPIHVPRHWARVCGIDFGINQEHQQAAAWLAWDRDQDIIYLVDEYKAPDKSVGQHAQAIKMRGKWIPVAWPHDGMHREKGSGKLLKDQYVLNDVLMLNRSARYDNDKGGPQPVEPIVTEISERIDTGRFKVFATCRKFMDEFRGLHRKDGVIQPVRDDLFKAVSYAMMMRRFAITEPVSRGTRKMEPVMRAWAP